MRPLSTAAAALVLAASAAAGCGDGEDASPPTSTPKSVDQRPKAPPAQAPWDRKATPKQAPGAPVQHEVQRAVRAYVGSLDAGDGERACSLLAPEAIAELQLPEQRGGCAESLDASIGYRDPRGLPVFEGVRIAEVLSVEVEEESAKAVVTVVTGFADRDEPSIEDDVIYLVRADGRWRVAKPSTVLYRAVGIADIPPSVLAPP